MSLSKSYEISCEANHVLIRRDQEADVDPDVNRPARIANLSKCVKYSERCWSAKDARSTARKAGWIRHAESFPLYRGAGDEDRSKITFDVCPVCIPLVVVPTEPLPDVHCTECAASLTTEAGLWVDKLSGDAGGTYDHCPVSGGSHRPAR